MNFNYIELYTDGACSGNPGPGGYAAIIIRENSEEKICGFRENTTNNRMELKAVIEGIKYINNSKKIIIYSDSGYVIKGITNWINNWKKNGWKTAGNKIVKNQKLWRELDYLNKIYNLTFKKVKGHSGNTYNEKVDKLAKQEIKNNQEG
ncbi:MAG: ribonuclease HI [bacterium]